MNFKILEHVYGSNPYSFDSNICKAALHSNYVGISGGFFIKYPVGQIRSFRGTIKNNVKSVNWVQFAEGFKITLVTSEVQDFINEYNKPNICGSLFSDRIVFCKGNKNGCDDDYGVWGSNPYTFDCSACRGALHSGAIDSNGGHYLVKGIEIYDSFVKSQGKSGIQSQEWLVTYQGYIIEKI